MIESVGIEVIKESPLFWGFFIIFTYFIMRETSRHSK
jgi:hypothetical protein